MYLGFREFVYFVAIHNRVLDITNFDFLLISLKRKYQFHKTNKTIAVVWLLPKQKQKPMDLVEHIRLDLYTKVFTCWDALWDMQQTYLTFLGWYLFHSFTLRCKKYSLKYCIVLLSFLTKKNAVFSGEARDFTCCQNSSIMTSTSCTWSFQGLYMEHRSAAVILLAITSRLKSQHQNTTNTPQQHPSPRYLPYYW